MSCTPNQLAAALRWRNKNREKAIASAREWRLANMPRVLAYQRQYRRDNPEMHRAMDRRKYLKNIDTVKAQHKRYREEHPEICRASDKAKRLASPALYHAIRVRNKAIRRDRQYGTNDGTVTIVIVRQLFEIVLHCPYCGVLLSEANRHLDHKEPLSRGGRHTLTNVLPCCKACNLKKGCTPYTTWLKEISR